MDSSFLKIIVKTIPRHKSLLITPLLLPLLYLAHANYTGNFNAEAVRSRQLIEEEESRPPDSEVQTLLSQPFRYLDRGHQAFALLGSDGQTVIKLFNFARNDPPLWLRLLPPIPQVVGYKERREKGGLYRLQRMIDGYQIAWEGGRERYGLCYIHLAVTKETFAQPLVAYDRLGIAHTIDLDSALFVLQQKAAVARELFSSLLCAKDIEGVKRKIDQMLILYREEKREGVYDRDNNFLDNIGYIGERAIRIDVGRLRKGCDPKEKKRVHKRWLQWLNSHFPQFAEELTSYLVDHF